MAYQHPMHFLIGTEGLALLRGFMGDHDADYAAKRIAEIRRLLDSPELAEGVDVDEVNTVDGYRMWSRTYDEPGNGLYPLEEPFVHEIIDTLPVGTAVDAACGTGRHASYLVDRGHQVIGIDSSPDMLARAHDRVPAAEFHIADLDQLPLPDDHADLVVCGLALAHLPDLAPAFAEFARVLRPGGHLITTDIHQESVLMGSVPHVRGHDGQPALIPSYRHRASDYLDAAMPVRFEVRRCAEPLREPYHRVDDEMPAQLEPQDWDHWPWTLFRLVPGAAAGAWRETPAVMLWHFQLAD